MILNSGPNPSDHAPMARLISSPMPTTVSGREGSIPPEYQARSSSLKTSAATLGFVEARCRITSWAIGALSECAAIESGIVQRSESKSMSSTVIVPSSTALAAYHSRNTGKAKSVPPSLW